MTGRRAASGVRGGVPTVGAVLGALCIAAALASVIWGLRPVIFRSGSMAPAIHTGDLAISREVAAADLRVGDVVTVHTATGTLVTHRIVEITRRPGGATLQLRGDANDTSDAELYTVRSAYRVWFSIPRAGYAAAWLAGPTGMLLVGLYLGALLWSLLGGRTAPVARHAAAAALLLIATGSAGLLARETTPTQAYFVDDAAASGSSLTALTVPPSASFNCGLLGVLSVGFSWTAVSGATSYTLHYGSGGSMTSTVAGTSASISALITGGTAWVQANRAFGSTTWTSAPSNSRAYTVAVVSLCA